MTFADIRKIIGLTPKTLPQAQDTIDTAAAFATSVDALFSAEGLDLGKMLAAGPGALKAHCDVLRGNDAALATAQAKVTELEGKVATFTASLNSETVRFSVLASALAPIGITAATKPEEYPALIAAHVKKESALELAKSGHRPVAETTSDGTAIPSATATRADHYKYMATLPAEKQAEYFKANLAPKTPEARYGLTSQSRK